MTSNNIFAGAKLTPTLTFLNGDILCDRYLILEQTQGGFGQIYFCMDKTDETACVLKAHQIQFSEGVTKRDASLFLVEAKRHIRVPPHPNVIRFLRMEVIQDIYFIALEWVRVSLQDRLDRKETFTLPEILGFLIGICRGLIHCGKWLSEPGHPFVHGDLKPENLYIAPSGQVRIADFGGGGTHGYASPEQESGEEMDERSDIYSIGIILQELLNHTREVDKKDPVFLRTKDLAAHSVKFERENRVQSLRELKDSLADLYFDSTGQPFPEAEEIFEDPTEQKLNQVCAEVLTGDWVSAANILTQLISNHGAFSNDGTQGRIICTMGDMLYAQGMYQESLQLYDYANFLIGEKNPTAWAAKASALIRLRQWKAAHDCAARAITIDRYNFQAIRAAVDAMVGMEMFHELSYPDEALRLLYEKQPYRREALRCRGYVRFLQEDYATAASLFEEYLEHDKNDWESIYYHAVCLYLEHDVTPAKEGFRQAIRLIDAGGEEELNHNKLFCLCISSYVIGDIQRVNQCFDRYGKSGQLDTRMEALRQQTKADQYLLGRFYDRCKEAVEEMEPPENIYVVNPDRMYDFVIRQLREQNDELTQLVGDDHFSYAAISLQLMHTINEAAACIQSGRYAEAAEACDRALAWDKSSSEALFNKGMAHSQLGNWESAVDCFEKAEKWQQDVEKKMEIRQKLRETRERISNSDDYRVQLARNMIHQALSWNGSPEPLRRMIEGRETYIDDQFLQAYITVMHIFLLQSAAENFAGLPAAPIDASLLYCAGVMQQMTGPTQEIFIEAAIQTFDTLLERYGNHWDKRVLLRCLSFRSMAYLSRKRGNRQKNLEIAVEDLGRLIPLCREVEEDNGILASLHNDLGNAYLSMENSESLEKANGYYLEAIELTSEEKDPSSWALYQFNLGMCEKKRRRCPQAATAFGNSLKYFSLLNNPQKYADANIEIGSLYLRLPLGGKRGYDDVIRGFQNAQQFYTQEDYPERYADIQLRIVSALKKRYALAGDDSLVLAEAYFKTIDPNVLNETGRAYYESLIPMFQ